MNYGDLKSHFNDLLNRSDITPTLTTQFIDQGIARIQRQLRIPANEKLKNYTISGLASEITLPTDFLEIISLYANEYELQRITMSKYRELANNAYEGKPQFFVREQEKLKLFPQPTSGTVSLYYYGEFDAMTQDSDENILAKIAPDLIIYSGLTYAAPYYLDQRSEIFEQRYTQFLAELQEQANDQELNGGTQAIRPAYEYRDAI
jgi:hypothetical protein